MQAFSVLVDTRWFGASVAREAGDVTRTVPGARIADTLPSGTRLAGDDHRPA